MDNAQIVIQTPGILLMKQSKRLFLLSLAIIVGLGGAAATAIAQSGDQIVTLCFRNRTIKVPSYLVSRYVAKGATRDACPTTNP